MIKNVIKLSLVAATAVAGISTVSSASKLEDAVKNTDLTGYVRYRFTDGSNDQNTSKGPYTSAINQNHEYKTVFNVKSKVNDIVTANIKVAGAASTNDATGDLDPDQTAIKHANFIFNTGFATITAGKQGLISPLTDGADHQGTGVTAVLPLGAVNLAGGWYANTDIGGSGAHNLAALGVTGKAGPVSFGVWGAQLSDDGDKNAHMGDWDNNTSTPDTYQASTDTADAGYGLTAMNVNVTATIGTLKIEANHASTKENLDEDKGWVRDELTFTQSRLMATINAGTVVATIGVITTGDEGGRVMIDGDTDASSNFGGRDFQASATTGATIFNFKGAMPLGAVTLWAQHITTDDMNSESKDAAGEENELDGVETSLGANYAMSKNFTISGYIAIGEYNDDNDDTEDGYDKQRIEMKYTF